MTDQRAGIGSPRLSLLPVSPPDLVYFKLFDDCNARCNMCACWQVPRSERDAEHYREMLDRLLSLAPRSIRFTGGEPLLLRELPDLVRRAAGAGVRVSVISNGRLLAGRAGSLADSGCSEIVLSLDGLAAAHNDIRDTPHLFEKSLAGVARISETTMTYGVNTVLQRIGIGDLPALADTLLAQRRSPQWWHLIPIRGYPAFTPTADQLATFRTGLPALVEKMAAGGVRVHADPGMFDETGTVPCDVPGFTAYVAADSGDVFGCNMLGYADDSIGNLTRDAAADIWAGAAAQRLRAACGAGAHRACVRCDPSSRAMNHVLRDRAVRTG